MSYVTSYTLEVYGRRGLLDSHAVDVAYWADARMAMERIEQALRAIPRPEASYMELIDVRLRERWRRHGPRSWSRLIRT